MVMKVTSIRRGFATNSSSVHSIVLGGNSYAHMSREEMAEIYDPNSGHDEFGWSDQDYSGLDSMINYFIFGWGLHVGDPSGYSEEFKKIIEKAKTHSEHNKWGCYVDHGSEHLSIEFGSSEEGFWRFVESVSYIEGGNDNSGRMSGDDY
jgi:hypothetical protein